jgi:hypothetical protein
MTVNPHSPESGFAQWDAHDAFDALYLAGLDVDHVEQARWPASAPQPRTHSQAYTFRGLGAVDPHLLLVFDTPEDLEVWRLWLARYWKARPYLSTHANILLLVSRDLSPHEAARFHDALLRLPVIHAPPAETPMAPMASAESRDG